MSDFNLWNILFEFVSFKNNKYFSNYQWRFMSKIVHKITAMFVFKKRFEAVGPFIIDGHIVACLQW